jgi:glutamyl-tRNA reductase
VAVRKRLAFADQTLAEPLARWHDPAVEEVVILSTCNRVECYLQGPDAEAGVAVVSIFWRPTMSCQRPSSSPTCTNCTTSRRCGIPQILGQVKASYGAARAAQRTGVVLTPLFERALHVAKMVRSATGMSDHAVPVRGCTETNV